MGVIVILEAATVEAIYPFVLSTVVCVPKFVSSVKVSINWFGKLKAAELSLVASLKAKADISDLIGCKSVCVTCAVTEADNADMVMLMENAHGTATLNTDIKGYISRDSGTTFTQGTLVDEGTWGTNKKILAFHDLDISGQPSGTSMCYKITTHNQSASSKETKIHATSIGWK